MDCFNSTGATANMGVSVDNGFPQTLEGIPNISQPENITMATNAESLELTRFYVQKILVPVITTAGLLGNIISSCVLTRKSMISSTNCYLTALAVFDTMYIVFSFTLSLKHYHWVRESHVYVYWYVYSRVFADISSNVSVFLTVTFTLERYVGVCHPMKGRVLCTPRRANYIIVGVVIFAFICTTPEFFEWRIVEVIVDNVTSADVQNTELGQSSSYQVGYFLFLVSTFTLLPLGLLCVFNGILVHSVIVATRVRKKMAYISVAREPRRQQEQLKITMMLISVVAVFLVCQFPNASLMVYTTYIDMADVTMTAYDRNNLRIAGNVVNLLILINASCNCVLYSVMSSKFRRVFLRAFCKFIPKYNTQYTRTESYFHSLTLRSQRSPSRYLNTSLRLNNNSIRNGYIKRRTFRREYSSDESTTSAYCRREMMLHRNGSISLRAMNGSTCRLSDSEETSGEHDIKLQLIGSEFNGYNEYNGSRDSMSHV